MVYPIFVYGTTVLRKKASDIPPDYPELGKLISDMFETMKASDGVGLAAPQVGLSIRLFVIDTSEMDEEENPSLKDFRKVFINPVMLEESGDRWVYNEGCLSLPELREDVERNANIRIRYFDENFIQHEEAYDGIKARIIQHEFDHLEGILLIDRIKPLRKRLLNSRLQSIAKGITSVKYKIRTSGR